MKVEIRRTAQGTEYWDTKEKRSLFVPAGQEPNFNVAVSPESMITDVDSAKEPDATAVTVINLEDMTIKELRSYAAEHNVEIPAEVKKKDDIIKVLSDAE
ncbi:Rho termination factor N-terminal domain-containing protein [Cytobacillus pseudoceanisediminis]|uniref:Rho termination factor N-terminal domain-containing protein n=1 Tax=Cytobacillus pseudoceanisediminis TaxID=3051614 RepID=UPI002184D995|nr:Rho termination factor N-terminal domain-containing protein [Cytobacillus pseudoceanisediminis]UQX56732.1 Rho termination factor N-terminal domain-containing protein [Cytobacillus pseudoceanisediminis]